MGHGRPLVGYRCLNNSSRSASLVARVFHSQRNSVREVRRPYGRTKTSGSALDSAKSMPTGAPDRVNYWTLCSRLPLSAADLVEWSGRWESNPRLKLGKLGYYHYT